MELTAKVALEVAAHEGLVRQAYKDSVGVWTWSVGITSRSGHSVERYIGKPQTLERCMEVWIWVLEDYAGAVRKEFAGHALTEAQFAAALSFHYNTGAIGRASWVKKYKAGDRAGARKAIMNWVTPPEITERRKKERDLFFDGKWSGDGKITEYKRLTSKHTPIWSSAARIDIRHVVTRLLADTPPPPDIDPEPIQHDDPAEAPAGWLAALLTLLSIFRR